MLRSLAILMIIVALSATETQDIALAAVDNMPAEHISVFVQSFRRFSAGRLLLFTTVEDLDHDFVELANAFEADIIRVSNRSLTDHFASEQRWVHFRDWLTPRRGLFKRVLFSDSRDVVFQSDPFAIVKEDKLYVSQEGGTIGGIKVNKKWVQKVYGAKAATAIMDKPVLCSGVTLASIGVAVRYLEEMAKEILAHGDVSDVGIDQGIHNHLIYTMKFGPTEVVNMETGLVMTLQEASEFSVDTFGRVLNGVGAIASIVHQYNRFLALRMRFDNSYPLFLRPMRLFRHKRSRAHLESALEMIHQKRWKMAEEELEKASVSADALSLMAVTKEHLGQNGEAEVYHRSAIKAGGPGEGTSVNYATFLLNRNRLDDAEDTLLNAIEMCPSSNTAEILLGRIHKKQKKKKKL